MSVRTMAMVWDLDLPPAQKFTLLALADRADEEGVCQPSVATLAAKCGMSVRAVQRHLRGLVEGRLILVEERPGQRSVYTISASESPSEGCQFCGGANSAGVPILRGRGANSAGEGCQFCGGVDNSGYALDLKNQKDLKTTKPEDLKTLAQTRACATVKDPKRSPGAASDEDPLFTRFWTLFPRKRSKIDALKAWRAALKRPGVTPDMLITAAATHARAWVALGRDVGYIPYPGTWLRSGAYSDPPDGYGTINTNILPLNPEEALQQIIDRTDAQAAADIVGVTWIAPNQRPSDPTDPHEWNRLRRLEFINLHKEQIQTVLKRKQMG